MLKQIWSGAAQSGARQAPAEAGESELKSLGRATFTTKNIAACASRTGGNGRFGYLKSIALALVTGLLLACTGTPVKTSTKSSFDLFEIPEPPPPPKPTIANLKPAMAFFAPDNSHLLVTLCKFHLGQSNVPAACRPWRYFLGDKRWERIALTPDDPDWSIDSASYSPDGKTIAATLVKCTAEHIPQCPYLDYRLLLIDAATGKHRTLASENARFKPSFTPDGKGLVYWQLDNLQAIKTGTTAMPARAPQWLAFTHNLHTLSLDDEKDRLAIEVRAQSPLAPPRVFADGNRVTISANGVFGKVLTPTGADEKLAIYSGNWGSESGMLIDNSFLIGNLQTGEMTSWLPSGYPEKVVFDVHALAGKGTEQVIYRLRKSQINVSDPKAQHITRITPKFPDGHPQAWGLAYHAAFDPSGTHFAYIFGYSLAIAPLRPNPEFDIVKLPTFEIR